MTTDVPRMAALIAAEVRAELARQGVSHAQLSDRLGVSAPWLSRRLSERANPRVDLTAAELVLIAAELGVPLAQLTKPAVQLVEARSAVAA